MNIPGSKLQKIHSSDHRVSHFKYEEERKHFFNNLSFIISSGFFITRDVFTQRVKIF